MDLIKMNSAQGDLCVFGLRGRLPWEPSSIHREPDLCSMDAPDFMPAGSMLRVTYVGQQIVMESTLKRAAY
jgi:hypothetical protein